MTERYQATAAEIEERRARAVRLRFARLSESEIAQKLNVSAATVCRDLRAAQQDWAQRFGRQRDAAEEVGEAIALFQLLEGAAQQDWAQRFGRQRDAAEEVGEAIALFQLLEGAAIDELNRLESEKDSSTGAKMQTLWAARAMRLARLDLLVTTGALKPIVESGTMRATELRAVLRSEGLLNSPANLHPETQVQEPPKDELLTKWINGEL